MLDVAALREALESGKPRYWSDDVRILLDALAAAPLRLNAVRAFVARVDARAEADVLAGRPLEGAHYRAMRVELAAAEGATVGEGVQAGVLAPCCDDPATCFHCCQTED